MIIYLIPYLQSLFNNKDKVKHHSCVIYLGICSCGADYIGETLRSSEIRWSEHMTEKDKNSDSVKHLNDNFEHELQWFVFLFLETYYIKTFQPSLNNQINSDSLNLLRNGVT